MEMEKQVKELLNLTLIDMIKVCHLTSVHDRFDARIFQKECRSLSNAGYEVILVVADGKGESVVDNIHIYDVGLENNRFKRFFSTIHKIKNRAISLDCDVYHFHDPELIFVGLALKKMGKKVIFDMHENIPADISEKEYIPVILRKILSVIYEQLEIYAVKRFDGIVSTRRSINDRLKGFNKNIKLVTNFPEIEKIIEKKNNEINIICFAGAIVPNWRHKEIILAIENIDNVRYLLAGPADINYLEELKTLKGWSKVDYLGIIPFKDVLEMYKKATLGVAIYVYCKNMDGTTGNLANTKLFEFMNWEIPIVCTDYSLWKQIVVEDEECGICVSPYKVNEISDAIKYILNNPEIAKEMGKRGRKAMINKYNWQNQEQILIELYNQVLIK
jgi:glycosyltransferase involved in cell wall biosynthesis